MGEDPASLEWIRHAIERDAEHIPYKELESHRGFLVYVTRSYPATVPYLKGIHMTLDGWRSNRDDEGWVVSVQVQQKFSIQACHPQTFVDSSGKSPPPTVAAVPRLKDDVEALRQLFGGAMPVLRRARPASVAVGIYGFGDASGQGFGSSLVKGNDLIYCFGQWANQVTGESSNYRELYNLIQAIDEHSQDGTLENCELFLFTDNTTAEAAFYKGTSQLRRLFELILRLREIQMQRDVHCHIVHVAGTRMIAQGTDGLSRGDLDQGVFGGRGMTEFVPLHLGTCERSPGIVE